MRKLLRKNLFTMKYDVRRSVKKRPKKYRRRNGNRYNRYTKFYRNSYNQRSPTFSEDTVQNSQIPQILEQATPADQHNQISPILPEAIEEDIPTVVQKIAELVINNYLNSEIRTNLLYPCGLINLSNYCYVNAIIQALLACPLFYNFLYHIAFCFAIGKYVAATKPDTISKMALLFYAFHCRANQKFKQNQLGISFKADWMYDILHDKDSPFYGEQQDAEEFFSCLVNKLNDEMVDIVKNSRKEIDESAAKNENIKTPISDIFGGLLKFNTYRQNDETSSNLQSFFTLPLDLKDSSTIYNSLEALTATTELEGIVCPKTNKKIEAYQQTLIEILPKVLVCQVKCFEYGLNGPKKIHKQLEFPLHLEIDSEMLSNCKKQQRRYKLFAAVYHKGISITSGHYVASTYNVVTRSWIHYNDEVVKEISEDEVLKPAEALTPYLLFYQICAENNDTK